MFQPSRVRSRRNVGAIGEPRVEAAASFNPVGSNAVNVTARTSACTTSDPRGSTKNAGGGKSAANALVPSCTTVSRSAIRPNRSCAPSAAVTPTSIAPRVLADDNADATFSTYKRTLRSGAERPKVLQSFGRSVTNASACARASASTYPRTASASARVETGDSMCHFPALRVSQRRWLGANP